MRFVEAMRARKGNPGDPRYRHRPVRRRPDRACPGAFRRKIRRARAGGFRTGAFSKALGTGIHFPVNWHNVWVENARSGKPSFKFSRALAALLKRRGIENVYVSLTDEIGIACAFVVVEGGTAKARRKT